MWLTLPPANGDDARCGRDRPASSTAPPGKTLKMKKPAQAERLFRKYGQGQNGTMCGLWMRSFSRITNPRRRLSARRIWRSGVCAVVQEPFAVISRHKLLIAFLAYRDDARRGWASSDRIFGVTERTAEVCTWQWGPTIRVALEHLSENSPSLAGQSAAAHFD